jgi:L,D-peptidoglycan transpeptidase YkuD (ErfK/YbiS/YcfS/YnhG family)
MPLSKIRCWVTWRKRFRTAVVVAAAAGLISTPIFSVSSAAVSPTWKLPATTTQLVVGVAASWDSSRVTLQRFERADGGWKVVGATMPGRLGSAGLVWGRGLHPRTSKMSDKTEGDNRAPAGAFVLRRAFGYDPSWATKTLLSYVTVGKRDLFVEDAKSPQYNTYVRLDHDPSTAFERKEQMKQADPAHRLKIVVEHNVSPKPVPGRGSAILFHIWRADGSKATAGCTSVSDVSIEALMTWLDPQKSPVYVLLPVDEYRQREVAWGLPSLDGV